MRRLKKRNVTRKSMRLLTRIIVMVMLLTTFAQSYGGVSYVQAATVTFDGSTYMYIDVSGWDGFAAGSAAPYLKFYDASGNVGTATYWSEATLVTGESSIYKVLVPAGSYAQFSITRFSAANQLAIGSNGWNAMHNIGLSTGSNLYEVTGSSAVPTGGTWSTYSEVPPQYVYDAVLGSTIAGNSDLYTVNATFYDYFTDTEIANGWRTSTWDDSHTTAKREPFITFNKAIANYAKSNLGWNYPLYFGDFYGAVDGRTTNDVFKFYYKPNNSNGLTGGFYTSVVGLTDQKLSSNQLVMNSGVISPYFSESWLTENALGVVVNTQFPLRKTTKTSGSSSYTYYEYDSESGRDNIWFSDYTSDTLTLNYGAYSGFSVWDAASHWGNSTNGYGFFPFDVNTAQGGTDDHAYDYGFGLKLDIDFTLGANGQITLADGVTTIDALFEFTGDDDLWVYVDGVLVLDLGGDHKKAQGTINFASKTSTLITGVDTFITSARNGPFPALFGTSGTSAFDNNDTTKVHTLTIFYMERGMIESNLKFGFNFALVGNEFISEKVVNTANVNSALQDALKDSDDFGFTLSTSAESNGTYTPAKEKEYKYYDASENTTTVKNTEDTGTYTLQSEDSAQFIDQFESEVGDHFQVIESYLGAHTYTQSWEAVDTKTQETIATGTGTESKFQFQTTDRENAFAATNIKLTYTNTPEVGSLQLTKEIVDGSGNKITTASTDTFDFIVYVNLSGTNNDADYIIYPQLAYTINGGSTLLYTGADGKITLGAGDYATITGIPTGAKYKIVESANTTGYTIYNATVGGEIVNSTNQTVSGTISTSNEVVFKNKKDTTPASLTLKAKKTLDGVAPGDNSFGFSLYQKNTYPIPNKFLQSQGSNPAGEISFTALSYTSEGVYTYLLEENSGSTANVVYDKSVYEITVTVVRDNQTGVLSVDSVTYHKTKDSAGTPLDPTVLVSSDNINYQVTFANTTTGILQVNKVDNEDGSKLSGAEFKLVKAKVEEVGGVEVWSEVLGAPLISGVSEDDDGVFTFANLTYGTYLLYETKAPDGYQLLREPIKITISADTLKNGTYSIEVKNTQSPKLPITGGEGVWSFFIGGILLISISIIFTIRLRNKSKPI